jgi:8-oxo-dGTP pyrophosphatase MutT (NUDIX family)
MNWIPNLPNILAQPLPGRPAQIEMASLKRLAELGDRWEVPDTARVAAVMLLLYQDQGTEQWRTVLIQRTPNPHDPHSGQVSFPGGSWDPTDGSTEAVALREVHEEIGIAPAQVRVLGRLTELYIPVSNFLVHPFVGQIEGQPDFVPQPGEVAHILTPDVGLFFDENIKKTKDIQVGNNMTIKDAPYFDVEGHVLWGATAMMMNEFVQAVRAAQNPSEHV